MAINLIYLFSSLFGIAAFVWRIVDWQRANNRYTEILYDINIMEAEHSFYTAISFVNNGTIPATDVKIRMIYPPDTKIIKVLPPMKNDISSDQNATVFEFNIVKIDASPRPFTLALLTDKKPNEKFDIQEHETKGVKILPYNRTRLSHLFSRNL